MTKYPKLDNDSVYVYISRTSKSLIIQVIADQNALKLTEKLMEEVFSECGLVFQDMELDKE